MKSFTVVISDPSHLAGITAAREAYNAALPEEFENVELEPAVAAQEPSEEHPEGVPGKEAVTERRAIDPKPGAIATDAEYVQFVMARAAESYANQFNTKG